MKNIYKCKLYYKNVIASIYYKKMWENFQCSSAKSHDVLKFKYMRRFETSGNNSRENMERSIHR